MFQFSVFNEYKLSHINQFRYNNSMKVKQITLLILIVVSSSAQTISIIDFLNNSTAKLPPFCLQVNNRNQCTQCQRNYNLRSGECIQQAVSTPPQNLGQGSANDPTKNSNFVPCSSDSCGEAENFKSQKQFESFIQKHHSQGNTNLLRPAVLPSSTFTGESFTTTTIGETSRPSRLPSVNPGNDFSGTNNQVDGVDQADLLKTDGTYIYTISNQILSIILAYPTNQARVVSKLNFALFTPSSIFIHGNYLAVFGTQWSYSGGSSSNIMLIRPGTTSTAYTFIKIFDVSNRANPYLLKQYQIEGSYFDGRKLQSGFAYLISTHNFRTVRPYPWYDFGQGRRDIPFGSIFWYPGSYVTLYAVNIISFNLANPIYGRKNIITICAQSTNIMYMSEKHIYLTNPSYENGLDYTTIRKIFVSGNRIIPFADGKVRGLVNNQFSLDEESPFLRIATTSNNGGTSSNVFCLDYYLRPYGSLTNIAPGQRIFSARYVQKRLYLVTFLQIDPFFVISLSNHRRPTILGHLKIPGFSRYLHPYDQNTIIGLGRNADRNGIQKGLKISIFDVSNVHRPTAHVNFQISEKYASSEAEWEHKAFLFSASKNLLVIPANMDYNGTKFNGAFAFYISKSRIQLRSVIDHLLTKTDNFYLRNVERSLYIESYLYTKSKCLLRINIINESFDPVKNINIPCDQRQFGNIRNNR